MSVERALVAERIPQIADSKLQLDIEKKLEEIHSKVGKDALKLVIGSPGYGNKDWIFTDQWFLDISDPEHMQRAFRGILLDNILAEHV